MANTTNPNQLIVEGWDDLFSVVGLMSAHVDWPEGKHSSPVFIHMGNGAEEILKAGVLPTYLKGSIVKSFGVVIDADTKPKGRYESIRGLCRSLFPELPAELPKNGIVVENSDNKRFGVWIMPDNVSDGSIETFLKYLVPQPSVQIWDHAVKSTEGAVALGCPCNQSHLEKARLYTWLSWQDPPGQSPGMSLTKKILDPANPSATSFVEWFRKLYQLPPRQKLFT